MKTPAALSEVDTHTINVLIEALRSFVPSYWATYFTSINTQWANIVKDQPMLAHLFSGIMPECYYELIVALGDKFTPYFRTQTDLVTFLRCFENRAKWPFLMAALGKADMLDELFPDQASIERFIKLNFQSSPADKALFLDAMRSVKKNPITLFAWEIEPQMFYLPYHESYGSLEVQSSISDMTKLVASCLSDIPESNPSRIWSVAAWRAPVKAMIAQLHDPSKKWDVDPIQDELKELLLSIPAKETEAANRILFCLHETEKCRPAVRVHDNATLVL